MAFLDNSGDIILDAVLTDTGRMRLARGDGSFKITKFALGDDEIDYSLYKNANNTNGAHSSGSAYYDIQILQTPVLEAFTNNGSMIKSKLLSVPRTNILYLPVIKTQQAAEGFTDYQFSGSYVVAVDANTVGPDTTNALKKNTFFNGFNLQVTQNPLGFDQGLDTPDISNSNMLDSDLVEAPVSFIDDDNVATYYLTGPNYIFNISDTQIGSTIAGPRGNRLKLKIMSSVELATSTYLFTRLGSTYTAEGASSATVANVKFIDTTIRIMGLTTGYRLDIPIRFVKSPS